MKENANVFYGKLTRCFLTFWTTVTYFNKNFTL